MDNQFGNLIKLQPSKPSLTPEDRRIHGIELRREANESIHSSVLMSERNSSMRNLADTTYLSSNMDNSILSNRNQQSSRASRVLPQIAATDLKRKMSESASKLSHSNRSSKKSIGST